MPRHNRGPQLSDRPNEHGYYEIRWTHSGRSKRKSTGTGDLHVAQRVYGHFLVSFYDTLLPPFTSPPEPVSEPAATISVGAVIEAYLTDRSDVMAPACQAVTFGYLRAHFGKSAINEVGSATIERYKALRSRGLISFVDSEGGRRGGAKAGPSTVRRELGMLSTAFNHCIRNKLLRGLDGRPLLKLEDKPVIPLPPAAQPRDRWLTRDEAARLLAAAREHQPGSGEDPTRLPRVYRYIAMMMFTASRRDPVAKLQWSRIRLEHDPVRQTERGFGVVDLQEPGRRLTKKRRGQVPVSPELYPILAQAEQERVNEWYLDAPRPPYHAFRAAAKRAGLENVSPHVLRHSWTTWAVQDGVPISQVAGVLHDGIGTVERHYVHHSPEHLREAVNRRILST